MKRKKEPISDTSVVTVFAALLVAIMLGFNLFLFNAQAQLPLPSNIRREETLVLDLVTGKPGTPSNFNAWRAGADVGILVAGMNQLCTASLWYVDVVTGDVINGLAAAAPEANNNFDVWRIKMRQGIYWSDGVEITADDVVYTIKAGLTDSGLAFHSVLQTWVKDARAEDKYTIVIELQKSNPHFWLLFLTQTFGAGVRIMPMHIFQKAGVEPSKYDFNPPVCAGMYVLQSFDPTGYWYLWRLRDDWRRSFIYQVYKEHWRIELQYPGPKYVYFIDFGTPENKVFAMARGDLDMIMEITPEAFETLLRTCNTCRGYAKEFPWAWMQEPDTRHLHFNLEKEPFDKPEVRLALALAINITEVAITGFNGIVHLAPLGLPAGPIENKFYFDEGLYSWLLTYEVTLPDGSKFKPFDPQVPFKIVDWAISQGLLRERPNRDYILRTWGVGWWKYAPDVAEKILTSLGFSRGPDGKWRLPNGAPWKIEILTTTYEIDVYRTAFPIADQWRKFGVDVSVTAVEQATFFDTWNRRTFEDVFTAWGPPQLGTMLPSVAAIGFESSHSRYYRPRGEFSTNVIGLRDPYIDELVDKAVSIPAWDPQMTEITKRIATYFFVEKMYVIGTIMIKKFTPRNELYWVNYPSAESPHWIPYFWGMNFALALPRIVPKGAEISQQPPMQTPTVTVTPTVAEIGATVTLTRTATVTMTRIETTTVLRTEVLTEMTIIIGVVLLVVGFILGYVTRRAR